MPRKEFRQFEQQRLLELKRVQFDQQAGEDSNDSGLSSENSANSREPLSSTLDHHHPQRAVHFASEQAGSVSTGAAAVTTSTTNRLRHHPGTSGGMHSRRLPRSPSIEYHDMAVQCNAALTQLQSMANSTLSSSNVYTCRIPQPETASSALSTYYIPHHPNIGYSSDGELHHMPANYVGRRRPGTCYSSGDEESYMEKVNSLRSNRYQHHHRTLQTQQQQQQEEAKVDPVYWTQRLQQLSLQQEAVARRTANVGQSNPRSSGYTQESYDLRADVDYPEHPLYPGGGGYADLAQSATAGWLENYDEFGRPLHMNFAPLSVPLVAQSTPASYQIDSLRRRPVDNSLAIYGAANANSKSASSASLTTKEDVLAMRGTQKFKVKDWEMARFAAKYKRDEFRVCATERQLASLEQLSDGVNGLVYVQIIAGVGLHSSHAVLRDLYCVIEADETRKARTMIRTSTECFEWDELFDLELTMSHRLTFLIYQWDPRNKHRLTFYVSINLVTLLESFRHRYIRAEKLALRLEPKGVLYLEISYLEVQEIYQRQPASSRHGAYFGAPLDTVVRREGLGIPWLVTCCIEEVERRGLDVIGIYRLSGSTRCRQQLREAFERQPKDVDLGPDKVSDVHAVTGLLRDYLRALPEPLFTNSLYRMVLDAMHVSLPGDPRGVAKLMLSILDCLPPPNQETLLALLDHLKKVASRVESNRMSTAALAASFGPVLLYPSPDAARDLDPAILQLGRMSEVLKYLLDIWTENSSSSRAWTEQTRKPPPEMPISSLPREPSRGRSRVQRPLSAPTTQQPRSSSIGSRKSRFSKTGSSERHLQSQTHRSTSQDRRSYHDHVETV